MLFNKFCVIVGLLSVDFLVSAEETCSWKADGSKVCEDEEGENHNVWKDPELKETHQNEEKPLESKDFNELELEIFARFFAKLKDFNPTTDDLSKYSSEMLTLQVLKTFDEFDSNSDGYLDYDEIQTRLNEDKSQRDVTKIESLLKDYEEGKLSLFQFLKSFFKIGNGEVMKPKLEPYLRLRSLPVAAAKKIMRGSVQMFIDSDEDENGKLDMVEFSTGMKRTQGQIPGAKEISEEQIDELFNAVDKDDDDLLSFSEFQATIPEPPKSLEDSLLEIFTSADSNSDGLLSELEFGSHMKERAELMKVKVPSDQEIAEIFEKLDEDGDGGLNQPEMYTLFKEAKAVKDKQMTEAFTSFDSDGDGFISSDELELIVKGMQQNSGQRVDIKLFMDMLDQDNDGKVSLQEMKGMLANSMKMK